MKPVAGKRFALSLLSVQEASSEPVYRRGVQYYRRKKVLKYDEDESGKNIEALVIGSEPQPYKVIVTVEDPENFKAVCSCPYFEEVCKHSVAVLLTQIARANPGVRFDLNDEKGRESGAQSERAPKAKDLLDDPKAPGITAEPAEFTLGLLVLEKPLALIVGTVPNEPQGKVNILKVPPEVLNIFDPASRIYKLAKYLTSLPQITKGPAGGHRIPRGDEGVVLGHLSLCAKLLNTADASPVTFSATALKPRAVLSETESGELLLKLEAITEENEPVNHPVYFLGQSSWVLSENVLYNIDLSAIHKLFQFMDAHGQMTVKLEIVPKFLAVDLPILMRRMEVRLDETAAPFPIAIVEPPQVVIKIMERKSPSQAPGSTSAIPTLEISLGFRYGELTLPSRDETSAVEAELYTRTISDTGQSVWVKRLWDQESQVRRFLSNMQPQRTVADRFFFVEEAALDALFYLSSEQCAEWDTAGFDTLKNYIVRKEPLRLKAKLMLKKESYKFDFDLLAFSGDDSIPFGQVVEALFRNRSYVKLPDGESVRLNATALLGLLKSIGQSKDTSRPLYQALPIAHALETHEIEMEADKGFKEFMHRIHNFRELEPVELPADFKGELREYQKEGTNWLSFLREYGLAGILADDMGLGKTVQTLALLLSHHKKHKRLPSLIVAPTSVVYNWLSEAERFTPTLTTALFLGRDRSELLATLQKDGGKKPDVVFTTYGIIRRDYEILKNIQFEFLVLDEAQNIKNPDSVGAVAAKSLKSFHRLALSGTPGRKQAERAMVTI